MIAIVAVHISVAGTAAGRAFPGMVFIIGKIFYLDFPIFSIVVCVV